MGGLPMIFRDWRRNKGNYKSIMALRFPEDGSFIDLMAALVNIREGCFIFKIYFAIKAHDRERITFGLSREIFFRVTTSNISSNIVTNSEFMIDGFKAILLPSDDNVSILPMHLYNLLINPMYDHPNISIHSGDGIMLFAEFDEFIIC